MLETFLCQSESPLGGKLCFLQIFVLLHRSEKSDPHRSRCVVLYPIPAKDEVKINTGNEELDHLQLFDLLGEQIEMPFTRINGEYILPISALKKGVYTLVLTIGEKKINRKLIKS